MAPPVYLYPLDEPYPKKYKWEKLEWRMLSANDIDDFDKVSDFFGHKIETFYALYTAESFAEKCVDFIDVCKADYTTFISIATYWISTYRRHTHGTHFIVACKENDQIKLSQWLEDLSKRKLWLNNVEQSECYFMINYRTNISSDLRSFFGELQEDNNQRMEVPLHGCLPTLSRLSVRAIKHNLSVGRKAKRLEVFIASRLREPLNRPYQRYDYSIVGETLNVLRTKLTYLINATTPHEVMEAQQAMNIQLSLFNDIFCSFLYFRYSKEMVEELDNVLTYVNYVVKTLDYGMKDGIWCSLSSATTTGNNNVRTLYIPHDRYNVFADMFPKNSYFAYNIKVVEDTNQNHDFLIEFSKDNVFPVSFTHVVAPPAQLIAPGELEKGTFYFTAPCSCESNKKYHWICTSCQAIVRETSDGEVLCCCGVLKADSFKRECPACYVVLSTTTELKRLDQSMSANITWKGNTEAKVVSQTFRAKRQLFNILVVGASGAGKSTLLNSINCMERFKSFDDAAKNPIPYLLPPEQNNSGFDSSHMHAENTNESYARPGQSVTQRPKDYLVKFRDYKVNFIDTPGVADTRGLEQDALNLEYIRDHIVELPYLNGIMFVIKNTETKLSPEFENVIRSLYGLLPRSAVQNCCFVYTFSSAEGFNPGSAQKPLTTLLNKFEEQHNVSDVLTVDNQFCVDNAAWRHLTKTGDQYIESLQDCWNASKGAINELLDYVDEVAPVKQKDLQIVANLSRLDDILVGDFRRDRQSLQTRQIMASIAERCMTGKAIYFRNNKGDATPLQEDQWNTVTESWKSKHPELVHVVRRLQALLNDTPYDGNEFNDYVQPSNTTPLPNVLPREQPKMTMLDSVLHDFNKGSNYPSENSSQYETQQQIKLTSAHQSTGSVHLRIQTATKPPAAPRVSSTVHSPTSPTHKTRNLNDGVVRRQQTPLSQYVKQNYGVEDRHKPDNTPATQQNPVKPEKNVYNVLVLGASQETLTALYENLKLIHEPHSNDHVQVTDERPNGIGFSYIVGFGGFSIRFINEVVDQIQEAQLELAELVKNYYGVHGFVVLTKGSESSRNLIEVLTTTLPTRARKQNVYFVNVFAFRQNEASEEPPKVKTIFNIFDEASWKALRHQADSDRYAQHVSSMEASIHQFTEVIKAVQPVTFNDMKFVIYLKRLAAELSSYASTPLIQRLWATIDAHTVNDDAKSKKANANSLDDNELLNEAEYWRGPNETMYNLLRKIHAVKQNPESESNNEYKSNNAKTGATSSKTAAKVRQRNGQQQVIKQRSQSQKRHGNS